MRRRHEVDDAIESRLVAPIPVADPLGFPVTAEARSWTRAVARSGRCRRGRSRSRSSMRSVTSTRSSPTRAGIPGSVGSGSCSEPADSGPLVTGVKTAWAGDQSARCPGRGGPGSEVLQVLEIGAGGPAPLAPGSCGQRRPWARARRRPRRRSRHRSRSRRRPRRRRAGTRGGSAGRPRLARVDRLPPHRGGDSAHDRDTSSAARASGFAASSTRAAERRRARQLLRPRRSASPSPG